MMIALAATTDCLRNVVVTFDGLMWAAEVFVNGKKWKSIEKG